MTGSSKRKATVQVSPNNKKLKQMTLFETFNRSPLVVITPLREPINDKVIIHQESAKEKNSKIIKNTSIKNEIKTVKLQQPTIKRKNITKENVQKSRKLVQLGIESSGKLSEASSGKSKKIENSKESKKKTVKSSSAEYVTTINSIVNQSNPIKIERSLPNIPHPKAICLPPEVPNEQFGTALAISEFIFAFKKIFDLPKTFHISTDALLKSLSIGAQGFHYVNSLLNVLVNAIIGDYDYRITVELGIKLVKVPVDCYSAAEVARLCLMFAKHNKEVQDLLKAMESKEIYDLSPSDGIALLNFLCGKANESTAVMKHIKKFENDKCELIRQKMNIQEMRKELAERALKIFNESQIENKSLISEASLTPINFYGENIVETKDDSSTENLTRRQLMVAKVREENEKKKLIKEEKIKEEQKFAKMEATIIKYKQDFKTVTNDLRLMLRSKPIGIDRNNTRYWWFNHYSPCLLVEKNYVNKDNGDTTESEWFTYDALNNYHELTRSFESRDVRRKFRSKEKEFTESCKSNNNNMLELSDWNSMCKENFVAEMRKAMNTIISKSVGWIYNLNGWLSRLEKADAIVQYSALLKEMYECINPSFLNNKEKNPNVNVSDWVTAVDKCQTLSRLTFLLSLLRVRVNWENIGSRRCKTCNRGKNEMIVCKRCSSSYHVQCLKLTKKNVDFRNWICESCYTLSSDDSDDSDEEKESSGKESDEDYEITFKRECIRCKSPYGKIFACDSCSLAYHCKCHNPPLRMVPRGNWTCGKCSQSTFPTPHTKTKVRSIQRATKRNLRRSNRLKE